MNDKSKLELIGEIAQANNKNLELIQEINQLQSNWNSLREYCEENKYLYSGFQGEDREENLIIMGVLDKMNELEGVDNGAN